MVLSEDQRALQETARRFARERLLPDYQKRERIGTLDRQLVAEMGRLGLLGMDLPEELGGMGADAVTTGLIAEELAYGDFNISAVPVGISLNAAILLRHAQPDVVREWVPRMTRGDAVVAICLTEPRGGSDASNLQLRARRDGDHYVINGEKTSITFADRADAYLVFARTGKPDEGAKGVSAFFIPYEDTKGISRTSFDDVGSAIIATTRRSRCSLFISMKKPAPSSPSRLATGTRQSSHVSSAVSWASWPSFFSFLLLMKPGRSASTTMRLSARCRFSAPSSVFAATMQRSQRMPFEMNVLAPLMT
jgi:hypothetical protein